ncbi:DUF4239 domain-containing protein [Methylobacterium sp.]|uniref:bestrophin-like domain n=1 Tax=Methylobacterium sp. TaxID=409 RepID=UPI003B02AD9A
MLMGIWLDQPLALIIGILASLFAGISIVLIVLTNVPATRAHLLNNVGGIVASFFSSIGILLALLTGFVANDAWERQGKASRIVQTERANLIAAYDLSEATVSDMSDIQKALLAYANAVIADEFPKMGTGTAYSSQAGAALSALMKMVADPVHTTASGAVAHTALMTTIMNLREARGERLALSASKNDDSKWLTLLFLCTLTLISIGIVHVDKPRAQVITLAIFSTAMVGTLCVIALHERPFDGPFAIGPEAFERAKSMMTTHQE